MKMLPSSRSKRIFLLSAGILILLALCWFAAINGIGFFCVFHEVTGLLCPGCGNSRAALALMRLDFAAAWGYNPLFLPQIFYIGWVYFHCCRYYLQGKRFSYKPPVPALDIGFLATIILWGIARNLI